ncbi:butyrophilin-like protein 2 isoform X2 [Thunnus maccoyii]|uniref:butyrophilin-like protein 2 isoform X2 n=1 Tax=Thunnus maccoyii TaxID=8240 RepID=UPI001C4C940C|nr:butyrophilin-like protein 2 isoform X2 [Thunnus maccoyii]
MLMLTANFTVLSVLRHYCVEAASYINAFPVQVIEAEEGDDVSLECQQDAEVSLEDSLVEWSKDSRTNLVHVYRHGRDYLNDQKEEFKGRTTLFHEGLSRGNVTLQLRSVRLSDSGRFRCYVKKLDLYRNITLKVVQKGQNNPTQDFSSTPLPVETTTEPNDPDVGNMKAVYVGVPCVALLFIAIGVVGALFKYGIIKRCMERLRGKNEQKQVEEANGSEMKELKTSE